MSLQRFKDFAHAVLAEIDGLTAAVAAELDALERSGTARPTGLNGGRYTAVLQVLGSPGGSRPWRVHLAEELAATVREAVETGSARVPTPGATATATGSATGSDLAPAPASAPPLALRLKDDDEVAEDIELARLTEQLESSAEGALRDLRALTASLRHDALVTRDAALLHPQACALALGRTVHRLGLDPTVRLRCLQRLAVALVPVLARHYATQVGRLRAAGIEPARFSVIHAPVAAGRAAWADPLDSGPRQVGQVLERLVAQAQVELQGAHFDALHRALPAAALDGASATADRGSMAATAPIGHGLGERLMRQLLAQLVDEGQAAPAMRSVFERLEAPAQRLAAGDPSLWARHNHPWWQLLDRLVALCAVLEDGPGQRQDELARRCEPMVTRFNETAVPDEALCRAALAEVSGLAQAMTEPAETMPDPAPPASEQDGVAQFEAAVREQMAEQLRTTQAPAMLRRFLLGPWVDVLVQAMAQPSAGGAPTLQDHSDLVDRLLRAVEGHDRVAEPLQDLLDAVRAGLQTIGMPEAQLEQWLFDLTMRLSDTGRSEGPAVEEGERWRHDELPTVPIDLHGNVQGARARRDRAAWLGSLRTGDILRVFLDARWQTLQLTAIDTAQALYTLRGRDSGGVPQGLTRSALERLRGEGLATTVELGAFIARAMDTMAARLDALGPSGTAGGRP